MAEARPSIPSPQRWRDRFSGGVAAVRLRLRAMLVLDGPPSRTGVSFGIGIFIGCSPLYGLHGVLAIGLATLFRLNPVIAFLGTQISFPPLGAFLLAAEVGMGEWLRYGRWLLPELDDSTRLAKWVFDHALVSWALGSLIVGGALAAAGGFTAWTVIRHRRRNQLQS